ncbi:MAG: DUF2238 domain-containing protein [Acidobacteriota bacterium]
MVPVLVGVPLLVVTYHRYRLTPLVYRLIFVHGVILILGGHDTYARVPVGLWIQEIFDLARNHYDRLGHFAQGFIPAMIAREILLRSSPLKPGKWLVFIILAICLALSAAYEIVEWLSAAVLGGGAEAFLGTQGDVWDTQWDMFLALLGAVSSLLLLAKTHTQELEAMEK